MDEIFARQVHHSRYHLTTVTEEGVAIYHNQLTILWSWLQQVISQVSIGKKLQYKQNLKKLPE